MITTTEMSLEIKNVRGQNMFSCTDFFKKKTCYAEWLCSTFAKKTKKIGVTGLVLEEHLKSKSGFFSNKATVSVRSKI